MNPTTPPNLIDALAANAPTPYSRPVRVCVRGVREYGWVHMAGGVGVPGTIEPIEDLERLMREVPKMEVTR